MGLINIPDIDDGTSADGDDINSRMATIANLVNGNIDNANILNGGVSAANLATNSVTTVKINDLGVTAEKLATSAILLGYSQITTNFTTVGSETVVTGLVQAVTVPVGGRGVKITIGAYNMQHSSAVTNVECSIWDDTSNVKIGGTFGTIAGSNYSLPMSLVAFHSPAPGARTYSVRFGGGSATATLSAQATRPAFILVEVI